MQEKFKLFRFWEGYKSTGADRNPKRPGFQVRKAPFRLISRGYSSSREVVVVGLDKNQSFGYNIESCRTRNSPCKIVDKFGRPIAEVINLDIYNIICFIYMCVCTVRIYILFVGTNFSLIHTHTYM